MNIEHGMLEGDIEIFNELEMHGMIAGNTIVKDGGVLHLHGMISKNLTVETGAKANIMGMVSGDVINNGGEISILGTIVGSLFKEKGITKVDPGAAISAGKKA